MNKLQALFFTLSLTGATYSAYLDDWSNDDLCGWMESASAPEYIQKEVDKREILCHGGIEVSSLPAEANLSSESGTIFPSVDPDLIPEIKPDKNKSYSY
ncbi:transposase [Candidatus Thioglobus sp.]|nr:transposase [Candidatus Thioglobus sp.]